MDFLAALWRTIVGVLSLDPATADWISVHPQRLEIALAIAALAGVSWLLGDSVIFFFNRLRGWRFWLTLLLNAAGMVLLYLVQAVVLYLVGPRLTGVYPGLTGVVIGVLLSVAPMIFGVFVLIPYAGPAVSLVLQVWGMIVLWVVVAEIFNSGVWTALAVTLISWLSMQLLSRLFAAPVAWVGDRIWRLVSGQPAMLTGRDLLSGHLFLPLEHRFDAEVTR